MSDTYRYLPKAQKNAVDQFDVETFDFLLNHKAYGEIAAIYDLIAQIHSEGVPLNEYHRDVLVYPFKLWGRRAGQVMFEFRKEYWNSKLKSPGTKPGRFFVFHFNLSSLTGSPPVSVNLLVC